MVVSLSVIRIVVSVYYKIFMYLLMLIGFYLVFEYFFNGMGI